MTRLFRPFSRLLTFLLLSFSLCLASGLRAQVLQVLDQHGKALADALVTVSSPAIRARSTAARTHRMDQVNKRFVPEVIAIARGDSIRFPNSDDIRHHVYSFSVPKTFEIPLYSGEPANPVRFQEAGLVIVGCNIHDRMQGFIHIVAPAEYRLSDEQGRVRFTDLPEETLTVEVRHHYAADAAGLRLQLAPDELDRQGRTLVLPIVSPPPEVATEGMSELERKFLQLRHQGH